MSVIQRLFGKKSVVGVGVFHAPKEGSVRAKLSQLSVEPAAIAEPALAGIIVELIEKADGEMTLHGELVAFFSAHPDQVRVHLHDRPVTDRETENFLRQEYGGKNWKCKRYSSQARDVVIIAVFGRAPDGSGR